MTRPIQAAALLTLALFLVPSTVHAAGEPLGEIMCQADLNGGGTRTTTGSLRIAASYLALCQSLRDAADAPRIVVIVEGHEEYLGLGEFGVPPRHSNLGGRTERIVDPEPSLTLIRQVCDIPFAPDEVEAFCVGVAGHEDSWAWVGEGRDLSYCHSACWPAGVVSMAATLKVHLDKEWAWNLVPGPYCTDTSLPTNNYWELTCEIAGTHYIDAYNPPPKPTDPVVHEVKRVCDEQMGRPACHP